MICEDDMIARLNDVPKIVKAAEEKFAPNVIRIRSTGAATPRFSFAA